MGFSLQEIRRVACLGFGAGLLVPLKGSAEYLLLSGVYAGVILIRSLGARVLTHPHFNIGMTFAAMLVVLHGLRQC